MAEFGKIKTSKNSGLGWLNFLIRILFQTDIVCRLNFFQRRNWRLPEFIIAGDSQERIIGYNYPNFFLMGLGALDIDTPEIMKRTALLTTGSGN
jgi:hypothetical protein